VGGQHVEFGAQRLKFGVQRLNVFLGHGFG
jgi:hypothetical protein